MTTDYSDYISADNIGFSEYRDHPKGERSDDHDKFIWPEPMPLVRPLPKPEPFPVDALGAVLENAALGIADIVQCPVALAGCSVLAAASLAAQAHGNVSHPATGKDTPLSLFIMTVAESGERKSGADAEALTAVRKHEETAALDYRRALVAHRNELDAWETARAHIKKKGAGKDWHDLQRQLMELGEQPKAPRKPHIVVGEPTYEGLTKLFAEGQPSLGLFSAEGGAFIGGHAMRDEGRLRALTGLSELWDGSPIRRVRSGDGSLFLTGRRLALHLMVQPNVAPMLLADGLASGQGFLSRLLVCAPSSTQGERLQKEPQPWARPALDLYTSAISSLLAKRPSMTEDDGLDPETLRLGTVAMMRWRKFADEMERGLREDGLASPVRGLRNKTAEMVLRIAGVLAVVDGESEVNLTTLERGIRLALFFLGEAGRLYEASNLKPELSKAQKLLQWLVERSTASISYREIQQIGPSALREASQVKQTVVILEEHGLCRTVVVDSGRRASRRLILSPYARSAF